MLKDETRAIVIDSYYEQYRPTTYRIEDHQVCLDLETLPRSERPPAPTDDELDARLINSVPKRFEKKKQESKNVWMEENREQVFANYLEEIEREWRKEALDAMKGRIYCICFAFGEDEPVVLCHEDEVAMLVHFEEALIQQADKIKRIVRPYGHNYAGFDGIWLFKKAAKYRLNYLANVCRPGKWGKNCDDTMTMWTEGEYRARISMDNLAKFLGLGGKNTLADEYCDILDLEHGTELNGSLVLDLVEAGLGHVVQEYCKEDVRTTRDIYRVLSGMAQ